APGAAPRRAAARGRPAAPGEIRGDRRRARPGVDGGDRVREGPRHPGAGARAAAPPGGARVRPGAAARPAARGGRGRRGHRAGHHRRLSPRPRVSKVMTMKAAVAAFVHDGDTVVIEGFTHLICFAAGHEIIRQGRRDLTLARLTPDLIYDQMIAAGCARKLVFSWAGNPGVGSLHAFRRAVEGKGGAPLELEEYSHFGMVARFAAGAA